MKRFQIPSIPSTTNKSIRFPDNLIEQVEEEIKGTNCTFSAFVVEAVRVVLEQTQEAKPK
ncbi:MAG: YlcI/YnfO family protein [Anaeromassilibacillus sp.]